MTEIGIGEGAASQAAELIDWSAINWWESPHLAYAHGLEDGVRLGLERYDAQMVRLIADSLGGKAGASRREAVQIANARSDQVRRRKAWSEQARADKHFDDESWELDPADE